MAKKRGRQLGQSRQVKVCDECPFVQRDRTKDCAELVSLFCGAQGGRLIISSERRPAWCPLPILVFGAP